MPLLYNAADIGQWIVLSFRFGMKYTATYLLIGRIAQVPDDDDDDGDVPSTANIYPKTANLYP